MTIRSALAALALQEDLNFLLTNRIPRRLATQLVGRISRLEQPLVRDLSMWVWRLFTDLDLSDAMEPEFRSLHACFTRKLRDGARPIDRDGTVLTSPCDAIVGASGCVEGTTVYQAKGFPYTLRDLLRNVELEAVHANGVGALVMLSNRFHSALDDFITAAGLAEPIGGRGSFVSGAFLGGPYAYGSRLERGAVLDVGPHLLDLLEAGLGEIIDVHAAGDPLGWVSLVCRHASGVTSSGALCCSAAGDGGTEVVVYGRHANAHYNGSHVDYDAWPARVRRDFAGVARGATHPASVDHAFHLQQLIAEIESQLSE